MRGNAAILRRTRSIPMIAIVERTVVWWQCVGVHTVPADIVGHQIQKNGISLVRKTAIWALREISGRSSAEIALFFDREPGYITSSARDIVRANLVEKHELDLLVEFICYPYIKDLLEK